METQSGGVHGANYLPLPETGPPQKKFLSLAPLGSANSGAVIHIPPERGRAPTGTPPPSPRAEAEPRSARPYDQDKAEGPAEGGLRDTAPHLQKRERRQVKFLNEGEGRVLSVLLIVDNILRP